MSIFIGLLTFLLVINCLLLILLVLVQLPKKDAGAGIAFGGGAADALFGAGSGNALTKITKYATISFFALALIVGVLLDRSHRAGNGAAFEKQVQQSQQTPIGQPPIQNAPQAAPAAVAATNGLLTAPLVSTNAPAK